MPNCHCSLNANSLSIVQECLHIWIITSSSPCTAAGRKKAPMDLDSVALTTETGLAFGIGGIEPSPQMNKLNGEKCYIIISSIHVRTCTCTCTLCRHTYSLPVMRNPSNVSWLSVIFFFSEVVNPSLAFTAASSR